MCRHTWAPLGVSASKKKCFLLHSTLLPPVSYRWTQLHVTIEYHQSIDRLALTIGDAEKLRHETTGAYFEWRELSGTCGGALRGRSEELCGVQQVRGKSPETLTRVLNFQETREIRNEWVCFKINMVRV